MPDLCSEIWSVPYPQLDLLSPTRNAVEIAPDWFLHRTLNCLRRIRRVPTVMPQSDGRSTVPTRQPRLGPGVGIRLREVIGRPSNQFTEYGHEPSSAIRKGVAHARRWARVNLT
jgi:hypothetical protein